MHNPASHRMVLHSRECTPELLSSVQRKVQAPANPLWAESKGGPSVHARGQNLLDQLPAKAARSRCLNWRTILFLPDDAAHLMVIHTPGDSYHPAIDCQCTVLFGVCEQFMECHAEKPS